VRLVANAHSDGDVLREPATDYGIDPRLGALALQVQELAYVCRAYDALAETDVIHDHTVAGPLYHAGTGQPRVATCHTPLTGRMKVLYGNARDVSVVAVSRSQAESAGGDVEIADIIHHGVDLNAVDVGEGKGGYACFLGRMDPSKGVDAAIDVANRAGMPLLIAAKLNMDSEWDFFREVVAPKLNRDICYVGELSTADKYALLRDAVALLNPIRWPEPFGLVMAEALAAGTPVVARSQGAAAEIVHDGETGFLRESEADLADALLDAPTLSRSRCRDDAVNRFGMSTMAERYEVLYRRLLDSSS
jgi:glycosyltransferase involved in cell wall biosynthesis